jgi:hypothetical protein
MLRSFLTSCSSGYGARTILVGRSVGLVVMGGQSGDYWRRRERNTVNGDRAHKRVAGQFEGEMTEGGKKAFVVGMECGMSVIID